MSWIFLWTLRLATRYAQRQNRRFVRLVRYAIREEREAAQPATRGAARPR